MSGDTAEDQEWSMEESDPDSAGKYAMRANKAETRRETVYWEILFFFHITVYEAPGMLKQGVVKWISWRVNLLSGELSGIGEECSIKNCQRESVAYLPDNKSWTEGTPVCRRDYLLIKSCTYGILVAFILVLAAGVYFVVVA